MKRLNTLLTAILLTNMVWAQAPEKMSYQAVIRGTDNILYTNQDVGMQIGILQGSASGDLLYLENHTPTTNKNGLISIEIGAGSSVSGSFADIDWSKGPYFILTMTDPTGGTNYSITGTSQLLSVPYALHAQTAENITGEITVTETDPLFISSIASTITATDTAKWNQSNTAAGVKLDSAGIATMGYVAGPKTIDTKLDETAVDAFVANNGYLTQEKDSSVTNEIELPTGGNSGQILSTDGSGTYSWIDAGAGGLVADTISDGTTTVAPSQNAVFDGLALKAPLASPTFTGTATATTFSGDFNGTINTATTAATQSSGDNSTKIATTAYADAVLQPGTATGQMNYWNGTAWVMLEPGEKLEGSNAPTLVMCNGIPIWGTCPVGNPIIESTTTEATSITSTSALIGWGFMISYMGGDPGSPKEFAIAYGTSTSPTISGSTAGGGSGGGGEGSQRSYSTRVNDLTPNTTYYVRAYVTNSVSTAYGPEISFTTLSSLVIGDPYQGGKIFYFLQSGDPGYDADVQHGLIVANSSLDYMRWQELSSTYVLSGATATAIGTGLANTNADIAAQGTAGSYIYPARKSADYSVIEGGVTYDDWYIPSKDELQKFHENFSGKKFLGYGVEGGGAWSSTENDISTQWRLLDGVWSTYDKHDYAYALAIRAF